MQAMVAVPDPTNVLPSEGVTEVLFKAAAQYPLITLLLVTLIIITAWCAVAITIIWSRRYEALKSPQAAQALVEIERMKKAHQKYLAQQKSKSKKR